MDGNYVEIDGFDEIMHELLWVFDEIKPIKEELDEITRGRIDAVNKQLDEINIDSQKSVPEKGKSQKELSAFEYSTMADNEPDYEKRKAIYLEALKKFPNTAWLWNEFTYFLHFIKKDYENLEDYYLTALSVDPEYANNNGNYAIFLCDIKKDYEKAEKYYLKALSLDPESANKNGNYAKLLLITNRKGNATKYLDSAFKLNKGEKRDLLIELWFYRYAHYFEFLDESEKAIEALLKEGIVSEGWDLSMNVKVAIENGHPNPEKLKELADRITKSENKK